MLLVLRALLLRVSCFLFIGWSFRIMFLPLDCHQKLTRSSIGFSSSDILRTCTPVIRHRNAHRGRGFSEIRTKSGFVARLLSSGPWTSEVYSLHPNIGGTRPFGEVSLAKSWEEKETRRGWKGSVLGTKGKSTRCGSWNSILHKEKTTVQQVVLMCG